MNRTTRTVTGVLACLVVAIALAVSAERAPARAVEVPCVDLPLLPCPSLPPLPSLPLPPLPSQPLPSLSLLPLPSIDLGTPLPSIGLGTPVPTVNPGTPLPCVDVVSLPCASPPVSSADPSSSADGVVGESSPPASHEPGGGASGEPPGGSGSRLEVPAAPVLPPALPDVVSWLVPTLGVAVPGLIVAALVAVQLVAGAGALRVAGRSLNRVGVPVPAWLRSDDQQAGRHTVG